MFTMYNIDYYRLFVVLDEEINIFKFPNPIVHELRLSTIYNPKGEIIIAILFMKHLNCVYIYMHMPIFIYACTYSHAQMYVYVSKLQCISSYVLKYYNDSQWYIGKCIEDISDGERTDN